MMQPPDPALAVEQALAFSRHLARSMAARPGLRDELLAAVAAPLDGPALERLLDTASLDENTLKPALRRLRARVIAHVAVRDLAGLADLAEITETMTVLAERSLAAAVAVQRAALVSRHGEPLGTDGGPQEFIVVAMGKLGGRELNVSSDIDLIFVYPEDGHTAGPRSIDNFEFFTRLGRKLIEALAELTADGQVFRVDMRLRPNGDSGPLVASFDMLEHYFIAQGREWERYAWIKARVVCGDRVKELEAISRPFVFRKYLDYGAFNAMRELHAQIRREVARRDMADNVKLGPGGIREIEFIAQVFQLIRGGREPGLQVRPTLKVLELLGARGILPEAVVAELCAAYDFLRRLEHRLQYLEDQQTHSLPQNPGDCGLVAAAMGFAGWEALKEQLERHRQAVTHHFEAVFADPNAPSHDLAGVWTGADGGDDSVAEFVRLGYRDAPRAAAHLAGLRASGRYQQMPAGIRGRFDALVPRVIEECAAQPDPDTTLNRVLTLLETISRRAAYLALLQQYPQALARVAHLVGASSWAATYLNRHPLLLDELIDPRLLVETPDWAQFQAELAAQLDEAEPDTERQMDLMREAHHAQVFRLLVQDLAGKLTVERLADHLSEAADRVLELTLDVCWRKLARRHREAPRLAIVAYGKHGGKELGYASDLDLIFVHDDDAPDAPEIYARLVQRVNTWLTTRTAAGMLFETDLRLRPNGEAGLPVVSMRALRKYQLEDAWVWEHQALTRARFCAGDRQVGQAFEDLRTEVLRLPRDLAPLRQEVLAMRTRMLDAHGNKDPQRFHVKHDPGGLVDVEFIVQYLVLGHAHDHPDLTRNLGNIALLGMAAGHGLIPAELARQVQEAYRELRRRQHALRLNEKSGLGIDPAEVAAHRAAVRELWEAVFGEG